ncbi:MAG: galactose-1-phosphate uridylyltransferase [Paraclostridium sp.]
MREVRVDVFSDDLVIVVKDRDNRPMDTKKCPDDEELISEYDKNCPFCRGNEFYATEKTFEIINEDGWTVKSIYNKYPILDENSIDIYGIHEVMIDTHRHNGAFYNMSKDEFYNMFKMYKNRYKELIINEKVKYISIFKNFLSKAGASLTHPHSQIISMSIIPKDILNEIDILKKYYTDNNESLYEKTINEEIKLYERVVHNGEKFIVLVPYASMYSGEVRVICKDSTRFEELREENLLELSDIFKKLFSKMYDVCGYMPFNLCMHTHTKDMKDEHLFNVHFHIIPRKYNFGGFEIGNSMYVSSKLPKDLARELYF